MLSAKKEITRLLWSPKIHYGFRKKPATGPYHEPDESNLHTQTLTP
jgi:hypothetical protein